MRHLKAASAYQIRLAFQKLYVQPTPTDGAACLKRWYFRATHSRLPPISEVAHTVKRLWDGILRAISAPTLAAYPRMSATRIRAPGSCFGSNTPLRPTVVTEA